MRHMPNKAAIGVTAAAAVTAGLTMGDGALVDLGLNLQGLDIGEPLAAANPSELVNSNWWFLINPDPDAPVRFLFSVSG